MRTIKLEIFQSVGEYTVMVGSVTVFGKSVAVQPSDNMPRDLKIASTLQGKIDYAYQVHEDFENNKITRTIKFCKTDFLIKPNWPQRQYLAFYWEKGWVYRPKNHNPILVAVIIALVLGAIGLLKNLLMAVFESLF